MFFRYVIVFIISPCLSVSNETSLLLMLDRSVDCGDRVLSLLGERDIDCRALIASMMAATGAPTIARRPARAASRRVSLSPVF